MLKRPTFHVYLVAISKKKSMSESVTLSSRQARRSATQTDNGIPERPKRPSPAPQLNSFGFCHSSHSILGENTSHLPIHFHSLFFSVLLCSSSIKLGEN